MRYTNSRTYPITHRKRNNETVKTLDISLAVAVGVVAFTFAKGIFWGYMLKKWLD